MNAKYGFVIMIQEKWWSKFCSNNDRGKQVHSYVQRGLAPPKETSLILFYVIRPVSEIAGYAEFIERKAGGKDEIWAQYGSESVLDSKQKYEEFLGDKHEVSFIRFRNLHKAACPVSLERVLLHFGLRRLSRKGFYIDRAATEGLIDLMQ